MALTNRLRVEGTANLVRPRPWRADHLRRAGLRVPARRGTRRGRDPAALDRRPRPFRPDGRALLELERMTIRGRWRRAPARAPLRAGHRLRAAMANSSSGSRAARAPMVGKGNAMFSFVHTHDAATAIIAALDKPVTGAFNIVDDDTDVRPRMAARSSPGSSARRRRGTSRRRWPASSPAHGAWRT